MKHLALPMVAGAVIACGACSGGSEPNQPDFAQTSQAVASDEDQVKPRGLTADEKALEDLDPSQGKLQAYAWDCNPDVYGFTPSTNNVRFPAEYTSTTGIMIGFPSWGCVIPELADIVRNSLGRTTVTVLVAPEHRQKAEACFIHANIPPEQVQKIQWAEVPVDSVWIRDYGPEVLKRPDGSRTMVDMSYYPVLSNTCNNMAGRSNDDAAPTLLADDWSLPVSRPQVRLEGGNFLSDGNGRCFRLRRNANAKNCFSRWCYTEEQLNDLLGATYGCEVTALESMVGGVIDHIDMFTAIIAPNTVLVGRFDPADDPANAPILDRNADLLASMGYRVVRIPMPTPYCQHITPGCFGKENLVETCDAPNSTRIFATYTNSIRSGNAMLVPVYHWVPDPLKATIATQEQEALQIYQQELDRAFGAGAVQVIPIPADRLIPCQGAFHCVTMTYE